LRTGLHIREVLRRRRAHRKEDVRYRNPDHNFVHSSDESYSDELDMARNYEK
jgi:hypothetical protein